MYKRFKKNQNLKEEEEEIRKKLLNHFPIYVCNLEMKKKNKSCVLFLDNQSLSLIY